MIYAFIIALLGLSTTPADTSAKLTIKIEDVRCEDGNMSIAIYTRENDFMSDDDFFKAMRIPAKSPITTKELKLPPGTYAIAVYHDVDDSEEMEKSWIGIPKEPVGLSRNAIKGMSRPTFEDAAFEFKGPQTVNIDLRHF